jgi:hypothetical protein
MARALLLSARRCLHSRARISTPALSYFSSIQCGPYISSSRAQFPYQITPEAELSGVYGGHCVQGGPIADHFSREYERSSVRAETRTEPNLKNGHTRTCAAHKSEGSCESKPWLSTNTAKHHRPPHRANCECAGRPSPDNVWSGTNPIRWTSRYGNRIQKPPVSALWTT